MPEEAASFLHDLAKALRDGRPISDVRAAVIHAEVEESAARMSDSARALIRRFAAVLDGADPVMLFRIERAVGRLESDRDFLAQRKTSGPSNSTRSSTANAMPTAGTASLINAPGSASDTEYRTVPTRLQAPAARLAAPKTS